MAIQESADVAPQKELAIPPARLSFWEAMQEQFEWVYEIPGVFWGLWELAQPFRRLLVVVLAINGLIAVLEAFAYLGTAVAQKALEAKLPMPEVVQAIFWPAVPLFLAAMALEGVRKWVTIFFIEPYFIPHVGKVALERSRTTYSVDHVEMHNKKAAILQEGRVAAFDLILTMSRDPAFAARGTVILCMMVFYQPYLAVLITFGLMLEFGITSVMNIRMKPLYAAQNDAEFALRGSEYRHLDGDLKHSIDHTRYEERGDAYSAATKKAKWKDFLYVATREVVKHLVPLGCMVMLASNVIYGHWKVGDLMFTMSYWLRSGDPVYVFFDIQGKIMRTREQLRRLGVLCGIEFFPRSA